MHTGKLVFAQLMEHLPLRTFHQCVARFRSISNTQVLASRSVSVHGFCTTDLPWEFARPSSQALLPFGHTRQHRQEYAGRCQRAAWLPHSIWISRLAWSRHSQKALRQRQLCCRAGTNGLCTRYHDHWFVLERLSVGTLPFNQGCR